MRRTPERLVSWPWHSAHAFVFLTNTQPLTATHWTLCWVKARTGSAAPSSSSWPQGVSHLVRVWVRGWRLTQSGKCYSSCTLREETPNMAATMKETKNLRHWTVSGPSRENWAVSLTFRQCGWNPFWLSTTLGCIRLQRSMSPWKTNNRKMTWQGMLAESQS